MNDKALHFIAGSIAYLVGYWLFAPSYGLVFAAIAGFLKEAYDEFTYGGFDLKDFAATFLGGLTLFMVMHYANS